MLNEGRADYVRTAMAKGVSEERILFKHVLKNAMIPILTVTVLSIPFLITGSLLLEIYFGIPGMGNLMLNAINNHDYPVIRTLVYIYSLLYIGGSILTDISYTLVDPRVNQGVAYIRQNAPPNVKQGVDVNQRPDHRVIMVVDGIQHQVAHARDAKIDF